MKNNSTLDFMRKLAKKDPEHFSFTTIGSHDDKQSDKDNHRQ